MITDPRPLLLTHGADTIPHPGGTLLDHLERVQVRLQDWGAPTAVQLAGLCHASYGTDDFDTVLLTLADRATLVRTIGPEAESLVYLYGSCAREPTYRLLGGPEPIGFVNRFTGRTVFPRAGELCAFVEITAANELDIVIHNPELGERIGPWLLRLLTATRGMLSPAAWSTCTRTLARFAAA